jgi:hypothetical protein
MRFHLRTLLMVLALGPPVLAAMWLTASDPVVFIGFYGTTAGVTVLYHLWKSLQRT